MVKELNQVGAFNVEFLKKIRTIVDQYGVNIKEHNADYLEPEEIRQRRGLVDAVNIAPQHGAIQTGLTIQKCLNYGINPTDFIDEAYKSLRWQKWLHHNTSDNKFLCAVIAGHYIFSSDAYRRIYEKISRHENFRETIIEAMMKNVAIYNKNL